MKQLINADEYIFTIRKLPNKSLGHGLYVNHPNFTKERLLVICWTKTECRSWIFQNFIGKKGTKFNIKEVE